MLFAQPRRTHVLGIDIGGTQLRLALADCAGLPLARWSTGTVGLREPQELIALIVKGRDALLHETRLPSSVLRAAGVGAPGITDVDRGVVLVTSYLGGWRNVPLRDMLASALCLPVSLDNDVNVATLAEAAIGEARGATDFVFLAIGTGIGAGIMLRNQLHRGSSWLAGELGYMLVPGTSESPVAEDAPGALESIAGGQAIAAGWKRLARAAGLQEDLPATAIFDLATSGNMLALDLLERTARALSSALFNLCVILDVPLIVFGGGVGTHPALLGAVRTKLVNHLREATPRLVPSPLGADAQLLGAIHLALKIPLAAEDSALSPRSE